jgi:hypothetical protein
MKVRTAIAAASAVALIGGGGALALALPAAASGQPAASHTLKFISEQVHVVIFSKNSEGIQDKDVTSKGKLIGFDQLNLTFNLKTDKGTALVSLDINGGIMLGYFTLSNSTTFKGFITGGIGNFKGAGGTITAKSLNKAETKTAVTIKYST